MQRWTKCSGPCHAASRRRIPHIAARAAVCCEGLDSALARINMPLLLAPAPPAPLFYARIQLWPSRIHPAFRLSRSNLTCTSHLARAQHAPPSWGHFSPWRPPTSGLPALLNPVSLTHPYRRPPTAVLGHSSWTTAAAAREVKSTACVSEPARVAVMFPELNAGVRSVL